MKASKLIMLLFALHCILYCNTNDRKKMAGII